MYAEDPGSTKFLGMYAITGKSTNLTGSFPIYKDIAARGGFHLLMVLLSCVIFLMKEKGEYVIAALPILIFSALLFISLPAVQTRYILAVTVVSV